MVYQDNPIVCDHIQHLQLNIITARCVITDNSWQRQCVNSPYSRLYYVKSGSGRLTYGDTTIIMEAGKVYLIPAELEFSHAPIMPMEKLFFHLQIPTPDGFDMLSKAGKIKILPRDADYIEAMYRLFLSQSFTDAFLLKSNLMYDIQTLLGNDLSKERNVTSYSNDIAEALRLILSAPSIKLNIAELAKRLFVSESYLNKHFKKEVGMTISRYIDQLVMKDAKTLLSETDQPIAVISEQLGFCDRFYFSKRFQRLFGETPCEYRKRMKFIAD